MRGQRLPTRAVGSSRQDHHQNHFTKKTNRKMKKYVCDVCGYEYDPTVGDPENGIAAGTAFEDLPEDWVCPLCGVGKDQFSEA